MKLMFPGIDAEAALRIAVDIAIGGAVPPVAALPGPADGVETSVDPTTVRELIERVLLGDNVPPALQWLQDSGVLPVAVPEIAATVDFTQEVGRRHKDVWEHTKQVVAQAAAIPAVRWAALLHDVGKVPTRAFTADGKVTFYGHAEVGARMFDRVARRLAFPRPLAARVRALVLYHLRANQYDGSWTDAAVRRFAHQMGDALEELLLLSRADVTSARLDKRQRAARQLDQLEQRIRAIQEIDSRVPPLPAGIGDAIMAHFNLAPSRLIGDLKRELEAAIADGELEARETAAYYIAHLERVGRLSPS